MKAKLSYEHFGTVGHLEHRVESNDIQDGDQVQKILIGTFKVDDPFLWWPKQFGNQHLYDLEIKLSLPNSNQNIQRDIKVGIRKSELV